ncbi:MAG: hypothetical protein ACRC8Y_05825, partial [Chroococcales cyanobacterium]
KRLPVFSSEGTAKLGEVIAEGRTKSRLSQVDLAEKINALGVETNASAVYSLENPRAKSKPRWDIVNAIATLEIARDRDGLPYTTEELMLIACGWEPPRISARSFALSGEEHRQFRAIIKQALDKGGPETLVRWLLEGGEGPDQELIIRILDFETIARDVGLRSGLELLVKMRTVRSPNGRESNQPTPR